MMSPKKKQEKQAPPKTAKKKNQPEENHRSRKNQQQRHKERVGLDFGVVGIGASAGGLDALKKFFSAMPSDGGMAYVVIQHLDPNHESMLAELLGRCTKMQVVQAENNMQVEPDHVYLIPPKKALVLSGDQLKLEEFSERRGMRMPIDLFFRSLAENQGDKSICVILSGTGSDGTLGMKAVKANGGMAMVQAPEEAAHDGMPRSAINTGLVDFVLPVADMPSDLQKYVSHSYFDGDGDREELAEDDESQLTSILNLLKRKRLYDFNCYKRGTLIRRIERRMGINHMESLRSYRQKLEKDTKELEALSKDLLIIVTSFFRDKEAFKILEKEVVPEICLQADPDRPIRVWVPGSATGEEAYSLAILFFETLSRLKKDNCRLLIFATDIDKYALERGRRGVFPETIEGDVSEARLQRYFDKVDGEYRVKKFVRESITFSIQNLITDPPFSKIDLISCRNLLIYLTSEVQHKIISLFHFALQPNGFLFLGSAEGIGKHNDLFSAVNHKWRLYQKQEAMRPPMFDFPLDSSTRNRYVGFRSAMKPGVSLKQLADRIMLKHFSPCGVVINANYEILHFIGDTHEFLKIPEGDPTMNLMAMIPSSSRNAVRSLVHKISDNKEKESSTLLRVPVENEKVIRHARLAARKIQLERQKEELIIVTYQVLPQIDLPMPKSLGETGCDAHERVIQQLEDELRVTREDLESTIEQLETANEELKAGNEEVMSMNEEFQSTNEELETSKEELQSLNEELTTVNAELQEKVNELEMTTNDLDNLLASSDVGTIFLDTDLHIKRFTPAIQKIFHLLPSDIGRPLRDFESSFAEFSLRSDAIEVMNKLTPVEKEVKTADGHWYQQRVLPYRTKDNRIEGVVVTFTDVTGIKNMEEKARHRAAFLQMISDVQPVRMAYVDANERYQYVNDTYLEWLQLPRDRIIGRKVKDVLGPDIYVSIKPYMDKALDGNSVHYETALNYRGEDLRHIMVDYTPNVGDKGDVIGFFGLIVDITERKKTEEKKARLAAIVEATSDAIMSFDFNGTILTWNRGAENIFGYSAAEVTGRSFSMLEAENSQEKMQENLALLGARKNLPDFEAKGVRKDGQEIDIRVNLSVMGDDNSEPFGVSAICRDITAQKRMQTALRDSEELHRAIGENVPFGSWTTDAHGRCTHVTQPFLDMSGMSLQEVLEFGWLSRVPEGEREQLKKDWVECVETGEDWNYEYNFLGADGKLYNILTLGRPIRDEKGAIRFWAGFHLDNTERKKLELELQMLNETLEAKIQRRTADLKKNMMQLRKLALELSQTEQRERQRLSEVLHDDLQQSLVAGKMRIERVMAKSESDDIRQNLEEIKGLLEQSAVTTRNLAADLRPPILKEGSLMKSLEWLADWVLRNFNLTLKLRIKKNFKEDTIPREIISFLFEAAKELCFNVVKHADVDEVDLDLALDDNHCLHLVVSDNGRGALGHVLAGGDNKVIGIGLVNIKDRLQLLGGDLGVTTDVGKGFKVDILIPFTGDQSETCTLNKKQACSDGEGGSSRSTVGIERQIRVLIADDHSIVRDGLKLVLEEEQDVIIVGEAANGREAVELTETLTPDVIVMDINMPEMSGIEATRIIKAKKPEICIIGLSVNDDNRTADAMLSAGADAFHNKSDLSHELHKSICDCMRQQ